jgi:hypothetical protein
MRVSVAAMDANSMKVVSLGRSSPQLITYPPSTESAAPCIKLALGLQRNKIASATSWDVPILAIGAMVMIGSSGDTSFVMGVLWPC